MFSNILVFLDDLQDSEFIPYVVSLANGSDVAVSLLAYNQPGGELIDPVEWHLSKIEAEIELDRIIQSLDDVEVSATGILLDNSEYSSLAQALARHIVETGADLLILGGGARHLLLDPVLTATGVTTFVLGGEYPAHPDQIQSIQKVMVPLDCSLRAECVLPVARQFSQHLQAEIMLAHVVGCVDMPPRLEHNAHISSLVEQVVAHKLAEGERYLRHLQATISGVYGTQLLVNNNIRRTLHDLAAQEQIDLVILSAHGLSGNMHWPYGSVTTSFITHSKLPLLIVQDTGSENAGSQAWVTETPVASRPNHVTSYDGK